MHWVLGPSALPSKSSTSRTQAPVAMVPVPFLDVWALSPGAVDKASSGRFCPLLLNFASYWASTFAGPSFLRPPFLLMYIKIILYTYTFSWKKVKVLVTQSGLAFCNPMDCIVHRLLCPWDSPGENTGVSCHALLQGLNSGTEHVSPSLLHCRQLLYLLSHLGSLLSSAWNKRFGIIIVWKKKILICLFVHNWVQILTQCLMNDLGNFAYSLWILVSSQKWYLPHTYAVRINQGQVKLCISP